MNLSNIGFVCKGHPFDTKIIRTEVLNPLFLF
jgi:hypothetical protein